MDQATGQQNIVPPEVPSQVIAQDAQPEKTLKQSEVNDLVGRVKHDAYAKGLRDAQATAAPPPQTPPPATSGQSLGGMPQLTEEQVRQMIADEAHKASQVQAAQSMLNNFVNQMNSGKGKYSDFDETVAKLGNLQMIPHVVKLASETGMAGDVMYELGRNPAKVASLTTLSYINPQLAEVEMKKLADSIKQNQEGSEAPEIAEPLSQVKPSSKVGKDNGSNTVRDLRRKSWARN